MHLAGCGVGVAWAWRGCKLGVNWVWLLQRRVSRQLGRLLQLVALVVDAQRQRLRPGPRPAQLGAVRRRRLLRRRGGGGGGPAARLLGPAFLLLHGLPAGRGGRPPPLLLLLLLLLLPLVPAVAVALAVTRHLPGHHV